MLPSFEIYLSILSDAWMPWLADNRKPDKFEAMIRMAGSSFHGSHPLFFAAVIQSFKKLKFGMSEKLTTEMELLSTTVESPFGKKLGQAFVTLPFLNLREHFYNTLTGQSLGAYYDMIEHFFSQNKGIETKTFYAEKMLSDLNALMCIQLPFKIENQEDQRIVLKVKLALALQFQLLL